MTKKDIINKLKKEKDAVILAHYYTEPEIQDVADFVGDSFQLSKVAQELPNKVLVFCGVTFMGESAKLLSQEKTVLIPDISADCPMANMVKKSDVMEARNKHEDLAVVTYINSTAEIKSWSDVCVTSANAVEIIKNLPQKNILFIPDKNLGKFVAGQVPDKNMVFVNGSCYVHEDIKAKEIKDLKEKYPEALCLAHPECNEVILELADFVGSTSAIIDYTINSDCKEFIIATEVGIDHELKKNSPNKKFYYPASRPICHDMKKITLDKIIEVLESESNQANIDDKYFDLAKASLDKMMELS